MAEKKDKKIDEKTDLVSKVYRDYDSYDWSGKQVDKGSDVRRKGGDR
jgi:hypothetical protein